MAEMGLSAAEHREWARRNLESYRAACAKFQRALGRQRCDVAALLDMYRHAYGVELNAKDGDMPDLARWSGKAVRTIHAFFDRACRGRIPAAKCRDWYAQRKDRLEAPGGLADAAE